MPYRRLPTADAGEYQGMEETPQSCRLLDGFGFLGLTIHAPYGTHNPKRETKVTKFHIRRDGVKVWAGENFDDVSDQVRHASPMATRIELRCGSNLWAQWNRPSADDDWRRIIAARGQENIAAFQIHI